MNTVHKTLRLQHHRHTGKLLQHKHTSYHGLAIILGLAGLMIVGLNVLAKVTADDLAVYARVPAPIPTSAAVITSPANGSQLKTSSVNVLGTCPSINPHVIITIVNNGRNVGSAACGGDNTFALPITLDLGSNVLVARSTTITGDDGPDSQPITVTYSRSSGSGGTVSPPVGSPGQVGALQITTDQSFVVYGPAQDAVLNGTISGGTAPYHVHIDWGDGGTSDYTANTTVQVFRHHYRRTGTYDITMTITDSDGMVLVQHFAAVTPYVPPVGSGNTSSANSVVGRLFGAISRQLGGTRMVAFYGTYFALLAIFGIFFVRRHPFAYAKIPPSRYPVAAKKRRPNQKPTTKRLYVAAKKRRHKDKDGR